MQMLVAVRLLNGDIRPVRMLMVFVMPVTVLVLNFLMQVFVLVTLRQMQPEAKRHHAARGD